MNIVDKLHTEWAWRTKSGVPDINNPEDKAILGILIKELTEESDIEDIRNNLFNILKNINDPSELTKISKYASNLGFAKGIDSYLESKNLTSKDITYFKSLLSDLGKTGEFAKLAQNPPTLILFQEEDGQGIPGGNYYDQIPGFSTDELKSLYRDMKDSIKGTVSMGPGESFLSVFFKDVSKAAGKGDLQINGKEVELKSRTGDTGALAAPSYVVRGKADNLKKDLVTFINKTNLQPEDKKEIGASILSQGTWPKKLDYIYKTLLGKGLESRDIISGLAKLVGSWYKNKLQLDISKFFTNDGFDHNKFTIELAKQLARDYYKEHKFQALMISDPDGNFKYYDGSDFVDAIGTEIKPAYPSDLVPRIRL